MPLIVPQWIPGLAFAAACIAGCASQGLPPGVSAGQLNDAAQIVVRQATIWGAVTGTTATPYVIEVNGLPHRPSADGRLRLDDTFYLAAGEYAIGLGVWGSPKGHGLESVKAYACFPFRAEARARYVLRGVVDGERLRVDVMQKQDTGEQRLFSVPVAVESTPHGTPCAVGARPLSAPDHATNL